MNFNRATLKLFARSFTVMLNSSSICKKRVNINFTKPLDEVKVKRILHNVHGQTELK